jgi:hypothetical protein
MLIDSLFSLLRLKRKLVSAGPGTGKIYLADHVATPLVIGVIHPKIFPASYAFGVGAGVIQHEQHHIRTVILFGIW